MIMKVAAISAALLLGTMSHAVLAQAPTAPAAPAGTAAPAIKPPVTVPPKPAAPAATAKSVVQAPPKTIVGAKAPPPVNACKGLVETDCGGKADDCSFVKAYKTKAGKTIAGYCKSKPKPKAGAKPATAKAIIAPATAVKPSIGTVPPAARPVGPPAATPKN